MAMSIQCHTLHLALLSLPIRLIMKNNVVDSLNKLNFYVTAINKKLTGDGDNPVIGLRIYHLFQEGSLSSAVFTYWHYVRPKSAYI